MNTSFSNFQSHKLSQKRKRSRKIRTFLFSRVSARKVIRYQKHCLAHFKSIQRKIPWLHLISWCWNFVPKLCGNCAFPQIFHTRKLGEITVFYAVNVSILYSEHTLHKKWNFPLRISPVNVTKSPGNFGFGHLLEKFLMENFIFCAVKVMFLTKIFQCTFFCNSVFPSWFLKITDVYLR